MSGSTGSSKITRENCITVIENYHTEVLNKFKYFVKALPSGSFNSSRTKNTFGDIDLLVQVDGFNSKPEAKKAFIEFIKKYDDTIIVPFQSEKYKGKKYLNTGEIVTISYPQGDGKFVQIDNIFCLSNEEINYKQNFLDLKAEIQGLAIGLVKTTLIENNPEDIFNKINIDKYDLEDKQELEFNLSSVELQLRRITYKKDFIESKREILWRSNNWENVEKIIPHKLNNSFIDLVQDIKQTLKFERSFNRLAGIFKSMISIKSGEVNKPKGERKQYCLDHVQKEFKI